MSVYGTSGYYAKCLSQNGHYYNYIDEYRLQGVGEGDTVPHCDRARRCVVETAFHHAWPRFPLAEGHPPDERVARHRRPLGGSKEEYAWVNDDDK